MRPPSIQELVRVDLVARERLGQERYGTSLYAYNGRSAILDAYQEALDLACYLRQLIEEMTVGDGTIGDPGTVMQPTPLPHQAAAATETCPFDCGPCHAHEDDEDGIDPGTVTQPPNRGVQVGNGNTQSNTFATLPPHFAQAREHDTSECGWYCQHVQNEPGS